MSLIHLLIALQLGYLQGRDCCGYFCLLSWYFSLCIDSFSQKYKHSRPPQQELCESRISLLSFDLTINMASTIDFATIFDNHNNNSTIILYTYCKGKGKTRKRKNGNGKAETEKRKKG